jgi:phospholipid/cholesterol/gamma-HCH transport system substrate-binding protein
MNKRYIELIVGIFVIIGIFCAGYLAVRLGKMELLGGKYYNISAKFYSVSGLKTGARVEIAGVQVGQVEDISLDEKTKAALVKMKINDDVTLEDDVIASIKTAGLLGDKYINLSPGGSDMKLEPGGMIIETESAVDIEGIISKYAFGGVK